MNATTRIINKEDRARLLDAIRAARTSWRTYAPYLDWLAIRLSEATAVEPADVPGDVVTMDSRVELTDFRTGRSADLTLVYPDATGAANNVVSIFDPAGLALLGSRVGDVVSWQDDITSRTARIEQLRFQPESSRSE